MVDVILSHLSGNKRKFPEQLNKWGIRPVQKNENSVKKYKQKYFGSR